MIKTNKKKDSRLQQGDILRDVEYIEYLNEDNGTIEISKLLFPYVIVLTQDCDLEQDFRLRKSEKKSQDKYLLSVLVAPLYNFEHVCEGEHLKDIGIISQKINKSKTPGDRLIKNQTPRYHYLEFDSGTPIVPSVIDFKHYFSVSVDYLSKLKKLNLVCSVSILYREDISQRFSSFLSRIGLP